MKFMGNIFDCLCFVVIKLVQGKLGMGCWLGSSSFFVQVCRILV